MSVQVSYKKQFLFGIILLLVIFSIMESGSRFYEFFIQDCGLENAETASEYDYFFNWMDAQPRFTLKGKIK